MDADRSIDAGNHYQEASAAGASALIRVIRGFAFLVPLRATGSKVVEALTLFRRRWTVERHHWITRPPTG